MALQDIEIIDLRLKIARLGQLVAADEAAAPADLPGAGESEYWRSFGA
jgi:hypothetical protein